ncbi:MAG: hypothetical protein H6830_02340 [Planctomycetes bacterium]|nr:hypothetical protein [Planctomycetota bacterium]MCB9910578.1 hypothetical protein [Planctomycetota bacterium]MCB9913207.1 hypothetical protein [Planctomycetota bacterium]HRV83127.1 hypothetical protein [Planctomycetota bacterium]
MLETVEEDQTDAPLLAILMTATVIITVLTILAVIALFYWKSESIAEQYVGNTESPGRQELTDQRSRLAESVWVDKDKGRVTVPLKTAEEILVKEGL